MKILQSVLKDLASMGYRANQSPFNIDTLVESLKYIMFITCECVYLCRFAGAPKDLAYSVIMATIGIVIFISFISTVLKMGIIFTFINGLEQIINDSELNLTEYIWPCIEYDLKRLNSFLGLKYRTAKQEFEKSNRLVHKWCKIAYVIIVQVCMPSLILPKAMYCFFLYFTTDLGNDAFELPIPTW